MLSRQHYAILCQYDEVNYFHTCQMSVPMGGGGPHMNMFEEVPTDGHQIPLAGNRIAGRVGPGRGSHAEVRRDGGLYSGANVSWVMVTC